MTNVNYFDWEKKPKEQRHFSDDFRNSKDRELEKRITGIPDICRTYAVSRAAVYNWIYKYSAMAKKQVKVVVEAKSDTRKIKALEERIKELICFAYHFASFLTNLPKSLQIDKH